MLKIINHGERAKVNGWRLKELERETKFKAIWCDIDEKDSKKQNMFIPIADEKLTQADLDNGANLGIVVTQKKKILVTNSQDKNDGKFAIIYFTVEGDDRIAEVRATKGTEIYLYRTVFRKIFMAYVRFTKDTDNIKIILSNKERDGKEINISFDIIKESVLEGKVAGFKKIELGVFKPAPPKMKHFVDNKKSIDNKNTAFKKFHALKAFEADIANIIGEKPAETNIYLSSKINDSSVSDIKNIVSNYKGCKLYKEKIVDGVITYTRLV